MVEEPICAGGNCRDFGRECRARYARKRSLSLVSSLFLAAMLIRLSLENQQPFPRSLSLSNALSLSLFCDEQTGGVLGFVLGTVNKNLAEQAATNPAMANQPAMSGAMSGPPHVLAVNLAVFTAVQGGLTCWIKKMNKFSEIETGMLAMFGAGAALSVSSSLSGQKAAFGGQDAAIPEGPMQIAQEAVKSGVLFSLLNGAFMKIGQSFSGKNEKTDVFYSHAVGMLTALGLEKYEKNFKRGLLTDDCLLLLNDNALQEVRIPPGPRLKILNYVAGMRVAQQQQQQAMSLAVKP